MPTGAGNQGHGVDLEGSGPIRSLSEENRLRSDGIDGTSEVNAQAVVTNVDRTAELAALLVELGNRLTRRERIGLVVTPSTHVELGVGQGGAFDVIELQLVRGERQGTWVFGLRSENLGFSPVAATVDARRPARPARAAASGSACATR